MTLRPVTNPFPFIESVFAVDRAKLRMAEQDGYLAEARKIAREQHCSVPEAAEIVRRSRR
jgi:hypothetical protein